MNNLLRKNAMISKRVSLSLVALLCVFLFAGAVFAQESAVPSEVIQDMTISAADLGVAEPTLLPDSSLYFLKEWWRGVKGVFTRNPASKAKQEIAVANERLAEIQKMLDKSSPQLLKKSEDGTVIIEKAVDATSPKLATIEEAMGKYKENMQNAKDNIEQAPAGEDTTDELLKEWVDNGIKQQRFMSVLEDRVGGASKEVKSAREKAASLVSESTLKHDGKEKMKERFEKALEDQPGSQFKDFNNLQVLERVKEQVPEEAKDAIAGAAENTLRRLEKKLSDGTDDDREKFGNYVESLPGDQTQHFDFVHRMNSVALQRGAEIPEAMKNISENFAVSFDNKAERIAQKESSSGKTEEGDLKEIFAKFEKKAALFIDAVQAKGIVLEETRSVGVLYEVAKKHYAKAKDAYDGKQYPEAHGQIRAALVTLEDAIMIFEKRYGVHVDDSAQPSETSGSVPPAETSIACPAFMPPSPDFCIGGKIIKSERPGPNGCPLPPKCVFSDENNRTNEIKFTEPKAGSACPLMPIPGSCPVGAELRKSINSDGCVVVRCEGGANGETRSSGIVSCPPLPPVPLCVTGAMRKVADDRGCIIKLECDSSASPVDSSGSFPAQLGTLCPAYPPLMRCASTGQLPKEIKDSRGCVVKVECVAGNNIPGMICDPTPSGFVNQVCGIDGSTYGNECIAKIVNVPVSYKGACKSSDTLWPSTSACPPLPPPVQCVAGQFQKKVVDPNGCIIRFECSSESSGFDSGGGSAGIACTKEYAPVCGTNNVTYGNACTAQASGIGVAYPGECKSGSSSTGMMCPPPPPIPVCQAGAIPQPVFDANKCLIKHECKTGGTSGSTCPSEYKPVCGVDAVTYSNECLAKQKGVAVAFEGVCEWATPNGSGSSSGSDSTIQY